MGNNFPWMANFTAEDLMAVEMEGNPGWIIRGKCENSIMAEGGGRRADSGWQRAQCREMRQLERKCLSVMTGN